MADLKRQEELVVVTKSYDLILWSCHHTGKFPRNHRFVLSERIERNLYDLLEILIRVKYTRQRQELMEQANLVLEILRFQMRLAKGATASLTGRLTRSASWWAAGQGRHPIPRLNAGAGGRVQA